MKHSSKIIVLFCLTFLLLTSSCQIANNSHSNGGGEANTSQSENVANTPQILFLNYSMRRNSAGTNELRFINKIVAEGQLKKELQKNSTYKVGDLRCVELDVNEEPIHSTYVPNPLNKTVEYVNKSGELSKKEIELDSAEFSIRMQLHSNTTSIAIEQIQTQDLEGATLIITKIK